MIIFARHAESYKTLRGIYSVIFRLAVGFQPFKEQAAAILEKLVKKYGVSMEDLDEEIVREHEFSFHGDTEERLLRQIMAYEYENENYFEYEGVMYKVLRSFPVKGEKIELVCEGMAAGNG